MNEFIFVITAIADLAFLLCLLKFGKVGPIVAIVVNIVLISTFGAKLIPIFGFHTNVGNVFYATVFAAGMLITARNGKLEAYKSVWIGFISLLLFIIMGQFTIRLGGIGETWEIDAAMRKLFGEVVRIAIASSSAYVLSQHLNIWLFDRLGKKAPVRPIWQKVMASAAAGQLLDSVVFFTIAFAGNISGSLLFHSIVIGFAAKVFVAAISIPFIYSGVRIKPMHEEIWNGAEPHSHKI